MKRNDYSAGAVKFQFWFSEFKKTVQLISDGMPLDEIKKAVLDENLYAAGTPARSKQIFSTVSARIRCMDEGFCDLFVNTDYASQKLLALVAVLAHDTLFFDFVYEVLREKMIIGNDEISDSDFRIFFTDKRIQDETVAKWTDYTCVRLAASYKTMLSEAGVLENASDIRKIYKPILEYDVENWLLDHDMEIMVRALTGVR